MASKILKKIPFEEDILTLQKCYLSISFFENMNPANYMKPYAILECSPECHYICRLALERDMDPNVIKFNDSVVKFRHTEGSPSSFPGSSFPSENVIQKLDKVNINCIKLVPNIVSLRSLNISVVFEDVKLVKKWKDNTNSLLQIVKSIIQLYVVSELTVIYLKNLPESQRFGIHCFVVHRASSSATVNDSVVGKIIGSTKLSINKVLSKSRFEQKQKSYNSLELGGLGKPYQELKEIIDLQHLRGKGKRLQPCHQVLLIGPSGCGKTSLVHKLATENGAVLVPLLGPEVVHPKPGGTEEEIRKVFQMACDLSEEGLTILLLDDIDTICLKRQKGLSSRVVRATSQVLALLERASDMPNLVVIATTNKPHDLDAAVRRPGRLEREIYIGVPTEQQRKEILYILARPMLHPQFEHTVELCSEVARLTPGYVGADLGLLCHDVAFQRYKEKKDMSRACDLTEWLQDFRGAVGRIRPSSLANGLGVVTTRPVQLSDIGGLEKVKKILRMAVEWPLTHPEAFTRMGLPYPKGVLLYGPPGCAKTQLARALACATNTTFLATSAAELYSPFVGDAEKSVVELFHRARLGAPSILFIDEIDALVGRRGEKEKGVQERVLSAFLTEMDGIGVSLDGAVTLSNVETFTEGPTASPGIVVIGATNRPDVLDDALLRPGRFDKLIYVPPPDVEGRLNILKIHLARTPLASCVDLQEIAECTENFSGADMKNLVREAALHTLTENGMDAAEVTHEDFMWAIDNVRPSLSMSQIQWYMNYNLKK